MAFTTIQGDWGDDWEAVGANAPVVTEITKEQFFAENPTAEEPPGFPDTVAKVIQTTPSASGFFRTTSATLGLDLTGVRNLGFRFYVPTQAVSAQADNGFFLKLITTGGSAEAFSRARLFGGLQTAENADGFGVWVDDPNDRTWSHNQWGADIGAPDMGDVDRLEFTFRSSASTTADFPLVLYLFDVFINASAGTPRVGISADDGTTTQYSVMFASSRKSADNIPISLGIIPELIDSSGSFLTTAEVNEMYADNCDVVRHSNSPVGGGTLVRDDQIAEYVRNTSDPFHVNYTKNNGDRVWVWAGGAYKRKTGDPLAPETYLGLMEDLGMRVCRRTLDTFNAYSATGNPPRWGVVSMTLGQGGAQLENFAQFETYMDKIIQMGLDTNIHVHEFVTPAVAGTHFPVADWAQVTNYLRTKINAGELEVYSLADLFRRMGLSGGTENEERIAFADTVSATLLEHFEHSTSDELGLADTVTATVS